MLCWLRRLSLTRLQDPAETSARNSQGGDDATIAWCSMARVSRHSESMPEIAAYEISNLGYTHRQRLAGEGRSTFDETPQQGCAPPRWFLLLALFSTCEQLHCKRFKSHRDESRHRRRPCGWTTSEVVPCSSVLEIRLQHFLSRSSLIATVGPDGAFFVIVRCAEFRNSAQFQNPVFITVIFDTGVSKPRWNLAAHRIPTPARISEFRN